MPLHLPPVRGSVSGFTRGLIYQVLFPWTFTSCMKCCSYQVCCYCWMLPALLTRDWTSYCCCPLVYSSTSVQAPAWVCSLTSGSVSLVWTLSGKWLKSKSQASVSCKKKIDFIKVSAPATFQVYRFRLHAPSGLPFGSFAVQIAVAFISYIHALISCTIYDYSWLLWYHMY